MMTHNEQTAVNELRYLAGQIGDSRMRRVFISTFIGTVEGLLDRGSPEFVRALALFLDAYPDITRILPLPERERVQLRRDALP